MQAKFVTSGVKMTGMLVLKALVGLGLAGLFAGGASLWAATPADGPAAIETDALTPVIAVALTPDAMPFAGSDGNYHLVYELRLANARPVEATLLKVEAVDGADPTRVLGSLAGPALVSSLRTIANRSATQPTIETDSGRVLLMHLVFKSRDAVPSKLMHRLTVRGGSIDSTNLTPVEQRYVSAPLAVSTRAVPVLGPPLRGHDWMVINGCCEPDSIHRNSGLPVNGDIRFSQRFAIDFMRLNASNRLAENSGKQPKDYAAYGNDVLAVADGVVVDSLDSLEDQVPPNLPAPATINLRNADGNHLVIDIGNGNFAFYAHLQKGSGGVKVKVGDRVRRGQSIGTLGNSGNSSAPHLHFHIMDGPSVLGSNGLPFAIEAYREAGRATDEMVGAEGLFSDFKAARAQSKASRKASLPLDFTLVDF